MHEILQYETNWQILYIKKTEIFLLLLTNQKAEKVKTGCVTDPS